MAYDSWDMYIQYYNPDTLMAYFNAMRDSLNLNPEYNFIREEGVLDMLDFLTDTETKKKYTWISSYASPSVTIEKSDFDTLYESLILYLPQLTPELIKEYMRLKIYLDSEHCYDHPWHFSSHTDPDNCVTSDSIMNELQNVRRIIKDETIVRNSVAGYNIFKDSTINDSIRMEWLKQCIEWYPCAHVNYTKEQIDSGIRTLNLVVDSLEKTIYHRQLR